MSADDWASLPSALLIERIVAEFHEAEFEALDRLGGELAALDAQGRGAGPAAFEALEQAFGAFASELTSHFRKEESVFFPLTLRALDDPGVRPFMAEPMEAMVSDHEDLLPMVDALRSALLGVQAPTELHAQLDALERHLREHMRVEDEVLFPRLRGERPATG